MKKLNENEMRTVDGGASKKVSCPCCGYTRKTRLWERWFSSNSEVEAKMSTLHHRIMTGFNPSESVHY